MHKKLPFDVSIVRPCEESWGAMHGDMRERHCELCDRQVHNFAAMTAKHIDKLVRESGGKLCARITRRGDGSLVTLESRSRASVAAQVVASASLVIGAAGVAAQGSNEQGSQQQAVLTGTVLKPDGSGPAQGAFVTAKASGTTKAFVRTNEYGVFQLALPAGTYDIGIGEGFFSQVRVYDTDLHAGMQTISPVRLPERVVEITTGGALAITRYTFVGAVTHPWSYLKYLVRKV